MQKKLVICLFFFLFSVQCQTQKSKQEYQLQIYTHDSFMAKNGPGLQIISKFESRCQCKVNALTVGDAAQVLGRMELDSKRGKSDAQVFVGIDQHLLNRAEFFVEHWGEWLPKNYQKIPRDLKLGKSFLPYDYSLLAFVVDYKALKERKLIPPQKLSDLLKSEWRRNFLLQDPRTSTPGFSFLVYTKNILGKKVWDFWKNLRDQWLALTPGWDGAYGLFLKGEAPMVWSYVTSQAYHVAHGDLEGRYQAILFEEGQPLQIEAAGMIRGSFSSESQKKLAQDFLSFLLENENQETLAEKNWMFPVIGDVRLPNSYKALPKNIKRIKLKIDSKEFEEVLSEWGHSVMGKK